MKICGTAGGFCPSLIFASKVRRLPLQGFQLAETPDREY
jgi:hypothetical protein